MKLAPNLIIGASVYSLEEAIQAEKLGVYFLNAGSVYSSPSKSDAEVIGLNGLRIIVAGVAAISAVMGSNNVRRTTAEPRKSIEECSK